MRTPILVALLLLAGCGSQSNEPASDSPSPAESVPPMPSAVPVASGDVTTRGIVTVKDNGGRPEVCLGPVAESWPPQCSGPPLIGWSWKAQRLVLGQPGQPVGQPDPVRWGQYALTGRWDGKALTVTTAVPAALYDAAPDEAEPAPPAPEFELDASELTAIGNQLAQELPGALTSSVTGGHVYVDVTYDDGSLQSWADDAYGDHVVVVTSALVDVPSG